MARAKAKGRKVGRPRGKRRRKYRVRAKKSGFTSADTKLLASDPKAWLRRKAKQCVEASRWFRKKANRLQNLADKIQV